MILFLDFDGVLHPWGCLRDEYFCYLPRLERVLRDYKQVEIVICSDWRFTYSLEEIRGKFSPDIALRVRGQTPSLTTGTGKLSGLRRREAKQFLQANNLDQNQWCALDDWSQLWFPLDHRVVVCDNEFGESEEMRLRQIFKVQTGKTNIENNS